MLSRRIASLALLSLFGQSNGFLPVAPARATTSRYFFSGVLRSALGISIDEPSKIKEAMSNSKTVVVDVRGKDEISASGRLDCQNKWYNVPCSPFEAPLLEANAESMIPDKTNPVVLYCASGKRATKAKEVLESMGYTNVLNAGGFPGDMQYLL